MDMGKVDTKKEVDWGMLAHSGMGADSGMETDLGMEVDSGMRVDFGMGLGRHRHTTVEGGREEKA
jgi:hypothetical protein